jgi:hypothetical protein
MNDETEIKVGDPYIIYAGRNQHGTSRHLGELTKRVQVERVTATQVVLPDKVRFKKERWHDNTIGSHRVRVVAATEENLKAAHEHDQEVRRAVKKQARESNRAQVEFDERHGITAGFSKDEKEVLRKLGVLLDEVESDVKSVTTALTAGQYCHYFDQIETKHLTVIEARGEIKDLIRKFDDPEEARTTEEIVRDSAKVYARNIISRIDNGRNLPELQACKAVLEALAHHETLEVEIW